MSNYKLIKIKKIEEERLKNRSEYKILLEREAKRVNKDQSKIYIPSFINQPKKQIESLPWMSNGFLIYLPGLTLAVDPGGYFFSRLHQDSINISQINTLFISHKHVDHSTDADLLCDYLLRSKQKYQVIAPQEVYDEKVISNFHAGFTPHHSGWSNEHFPTIIEKEERVFKTKHGKYEFEPIKLFHGAECFGFKLDKRIVFIADTGYTQQFYTNRGETVDLNKFQDYKGGLKEIVKKRSYIKDFCKGAEFLIINIETLSYNKNSLTHLTVHDLLDIVRENNVKNTILTHINPYTLRATKFMEGIKDYIEDNSESTVLYPSDKGLAVRI